MREGNLRQLPVLTREKRMVGIVTLEDIAREEISPEKKKRHVASDPRVSTPFLFGY